jgi:tryptophan-rich sensory protein
MWSLLVFLILVAMTAFSGALFSPGDWYAALDKPAWTPPNWLFGPVWTTLYIAMAVAGWLVWRRSDGRFNPALGFWMGQLLLNGLWSWLFFGLHRPDLALADISGLLILIVLFIYTARRYSTVAAWLFTPYALWVGFAAALNFALWRLNPPM